MNIFVTGIGGMMGSHLADFLIEKGHTVTGIDLNPTTDLKELNPKTKYIKCDIRNGKKLTKIIKKANPEVIFHLAAQSYPTVSWEQPEYTMETNVLGTVNLFEAVKKLQLNAIILNACTSGEYGYIQEHEVPVKESKELKPLHPYGVSKVAQEFLAHQYFKNFNIKSISVRIFNTTGPKKVNDVCSDFTKQIVLMEKGKQEHVLRVGNTETRRAITDVRDILQAFLLAVEKAQPGETYNLSGEKVYSINDIIKMLRTLTTVQFETQQDPKLVRSTDEPIIYGDSSKFKKQTNWQQQIPLEKTLKDMLDYWRKKL